jgi:hypothetical protein
VVAALLGAGQAKLFAQGVEQGGAGIEFKRRVRPPSKEEAAQTDDVYALKPGERACDHPGCRVAATARAPKSRDMLNEHYWFCQPHAAEYNRNWNFFAGMSEGEIKQRQAQSAQGDRPTWDFKAGRFSREAAAAAHGFGQGKGYRDPFNLFGSGNGGARPANAPETRRLGNLSATPWPTWISTRTPTARRSAPATSSW